MGHVDTWSGCESIMLRLGKVVEWTKGGRVAFPDLLRIYYTQKIRSLAVQQGGFMYVLAYL